MSAGDPADLATTAINALAGMIAPELKVDPVLVARLAGLLASALLGDPWADAERTGLERAARIRTLQDAERAAQERR